MGKDVIEKLLDELNNNKDTWNLVILAFLLGSNPNFKEELNNKLIELINQKSNKGE